MKNDFALIIGINDYTPTNANGLKTLGGAINDANYFEEWILSSKGADVPAENCRKIISNPSPLAPIQKQIDDAFLEIEDLIIKNARVARRFYFYFAGHGVGLTNSANEVALCLANWSERRRHEALGAELYKDIFKQYGYFEEIVFILDCCRNSKINIKPAGPSFSPILASPNAGKTKLFAAYATQYQDQSFEAEQENSEMRGVFTKVLLDGLKGDVPNNKGVITADGLRDYLEKQVPIEAQKKGFKQIPQINSESFTSDAPFTLLVDYKVQNTVCHIVFSDARTGTIELFDDSGIIERFDAGKLKTVDVLLSNGCYLLRDSQLDKMQPIYILQSNKEIYVNF